MGTAPIRPVGTKTMTLRNFTFGAAVTLAMLGTGPVKAADLDPALEDPVQDISSMPASNIVFGSGWYVRGDAAVTNKYFPNLVVQNRTGWNGLQSTSDPSYDFSLGGGYAFTGHLRADVTVDFFQPAEALLHSGAVSVDGRLDQYAALANGYYDFGTWWIATPYLGAGVGVGVDKVNVTATKELTQGTHEAFAYAGMAGVAFDVFPHVKIDVGYRYISVGRVAGTDLGHHEFRAGLRYMIDN